MEGFWQGALLCLFLLVTGICICNAIYIRTPRYRNEVAGIKKFQQGVPQGLAVMNTGSNYAYHAIDWTLVGVKGFSLASGAQSLAWDFRLWHKYSGNLKPAGIVLFALADLVFLLSEYPNPRSDYRYYYFMEPGEIPRYTLWRALRYRYLPVLENWRNIAHCFYHRGVPFVDHVAAPVEAEREAEARLSGWKNEFHLPDLEHAESAAHLLSAIEKTTSILRDMVAEARRQGLRPVLMIPPVSAQLSDRISQEFLEAVLYQPIRKTVPDVPLLDYMKDTRFQDCRLYRNSDFMNAEGRARFMPILWHDVQEAAGTLQ